MNWKAQMAGIIAGSALALGIASGAVAQNGTAVQLDDRSCTAVVDSALDINFGTFAWNGVDSYEVVSGTAGNNLFVFDVETPHTATCTVTISAGDMTHETDTTKVIQVNYKAGDGYGPANPLILPFTSLPSGEYAVEAEIGSSLNNAYITGEYSGTVEISAETGS